MTKRLLTVLCCWLVAVHAQAASITGSGADLASPGPIGGTTPSTGAFTDLDFSSTIYTSGRAGIQFPAAGIINLFDVPGASTGVFLNIGTDDILEQRNGAADQAFRIYGLYTDASNYHYGSIAMSDTALTISTVTAGTGVDNLDIVLTPAGTGSVIIGGTTAGGDASAGKVGEYIVASVVQGSALALTTATAKTVTSITLTAGDWDITGIGAITGASTGTVFDMAIGTTTNSLTGTVLGNTRCQTPTVSLTGADATLMVPAVRVSISGASVPYYLIVQETFTVGSPGAYGRISARRVR